MLAGSVVSVNRDVVHRFSKAAVDSITLVEGRGVEGDAHFGTTDQHRFHVRRDPTRPNLRQVHLLQAELLDDVALAGYPVGPGELGENVTTRGIALLELPAGTLLLLGESARIELTGVRNPCVQIDRFEPGLLKQMVGHDEHGDVVRKSGVMAVVLAGGVVRPGDSIELRLPAGEPRPLQPV